MKSKRSYFFRGIFTGIFIMLSYTSMMNGAMITATAALAVIAILFHGTLGNQNEE